jgi:hypothetical protein
MVKKCLFFVFLLPCVLGYGRESSLVGKTFELRQPVFLYYSTVFESYALEPPGLSTRVPESIALFEQYGENWRRHDKQQLSRHRKVVPNELMEMLPIGTRITIVNMQLKPAVMFEVWVARGRIDDPRFKEVTFKLVGLLKDARTDKPRANPKYLIPVADDRRESS